LAKTKKQKSTNKLITFKLITLNHKLITKVAKLKCLEYLYLRICSIDDQVILIKFVMSQN